MADITRRHVVKMGGAAIGAAALTGTWTRVAQASTPAPRSGTESERLYLSGVGKDDGVDWDFKVSKGMQAGVWSKLPVPSNWQLHGFGVYVYGKHLSPGEYGQYKRTFVVPEGWRDRKRVFLVFEGSMTDTEVWINGESAGPQHQGAFYQFRYEINDLVQFGDENLLEVTVTADSANEGVNNERWADAWNFAGIFRPVYLEARPIEFIDRVAIDARADGTFSMDVFLDGISETDTVEAIIRGPIRGSAAAPAVGAPVAARVSPGATQVHLAATAHGPELWSDETPNLYQVEVRLLNGGTEIHTITQKFGFRTIEVRPGDGIYVNDRKVTLRGICRHSFWPDSGRTTSPQISRDDIILMKKMNVNAARMSHYPPDVHFLDYADELGLYVLNEFPDHGLPYDDPTAESLIEAMVTRDVNHPSIIFWDNGNEGGWNLDAEGEFAKHDPQKRVVLHPGAATYGGGAYNNILDFHYPTYQNAEDNLTKGSDIYLPTEFLHGLYDGGGGAGLNDYWNLMSSSPLAAGGFIWCLIDGGVVRTDRGGVIDTNGNADADGVVGPYRQPEGSYYTIKDIWSPIQLADPDYYADSFPKNFDGTIEIENRYSFLDAKQCAFTWAALQFNDPTDQWVGHRVIHSGRAQVGRSGGGIKPGERGRIYLDIAPSQWARADALSLSVSDPNGREVSTWVWTINKAADIKKRLVLGGSEAASGSESSDSITMSASGTEVTVSKTDGRLLSVKRDGKTISLANGPVLTTGTSFLTSIVSGQDGNSYAVRVEYDGPMNYCTWRLLGSGWLQLEYQYDISGDFDFFGINFDYPESLVTGVKWLGKGPYRVYKNRLRGGVIDVWHKDYNDTATGSDEWVYPEFKGCHANTFWASLLTKEGHITVVTENDDTFLRLYTPRAPQDAGRATVAYPSGDVSFLEAIPAIGSKLVSIDASGPESAKNTAAGPYLRVLYFSFDAN